MAPRFADHVVWITGGGSGIGKALALAFARAGAAVAISGRRLPKLEATCAEIEAAGAQALPVVCDVTDDASTRAAVARVVAELGKLDVVVANAGFAVGGRLQKLDVADWERQFSTNLFGAVRTVTHALPHLEETGGRIALIGSVAQYLPVPGSGAYAASKAALHAYGQTLALELKGSPVSCTTIHPGFIESEIAQVDNQGIHHPDRPDKRPAALMWTAEAAARPMLRAIWRRQRLSVITGHGKVGAFLGSRMPNLTAFLLGRMG